MLKLSDLNPRVNYCVVRDPDNRESIVTRGSEIQQTWKSNRDYYHYIGNQTPWREYLPVDCGNGVIIAVWHDPTRPELNRMDDGAPMEIEEVTPSHAEQVEAPVPLPPPKPVKSLVATVQHDWAMVAKVLRQAARQVVSVYHHG